MCCRLRQAKQARRFRMELWEGKVIFNMDSTYFPEIMSSHGGGGVVGATLVILRFMLLCFGIPNFCLYYFDLYIVLQTDRSDN